MRRFFFLFLVIISTLLLCSCAYGDAALYRGSSNIGAVPTVDNNSGYCVPVEDTGKLLGFSASRSGEELLLSRGNVQLRVIANSAAAWRGMSIVPLHSAPFERGGKLWLDVSSVAALFQPSAGGGQANKLRFSKMGASSTTAVIATSPRSEIEFGKFPEVQPKPAPVTPSIQAVAAIQQEASTAAARTGTRTTKAQPRYETFKPTDTKKTSTESYSGTIQGITWSVQANTKRIRAVIVADDDADPQVYMSRGSLHALFSSSLEDARALASPYPNIKTELKRNTKGVDLTFTASGITRAEKTILSSPRRIVFDFFFSENITATNTTAQPTEPIITVNNNATRQTTPAVRTPPSSITIPMTQTAAKSRKVIVVDPGHGGKDPGASANGVTEKNVNLGIGLELERILTAQGYRVIMTRRTDVYLKLQERTDIANNADADLFVSVHVNALPSKTSMTGFEIYIMALPTDKDAMNLAKIENREYVEGKGYDVENVDRRTEMLLRILGDMQQNNKISESTDFAAALYNAGARNGLPMRRVAQAPFFVLRGAGMPAVLLETGFVTNSGEAQRLNTSAYQNKIAQAMAAGISNYLK